MGLLRFFAAELLGLDVQLTQRSVNEKPKTFRVTPLSIDMYEFEKAL